MRTNTLIKYCNSIFFGIMALAMMTGCSSESDNNFEIIKTELEVGPNSVTGSILLSTADFSFTVSQTWCEVTKDENTLLVSAGVNYDFNNRSAEIVITSDSGNKEYRVPVTQTGILFEFSEGESKDYNMNLAGGTRTLTVLSNIDYTLEVSEDSKDWLHVDALEGDGEYLVTIDESTIRRAGSAYFVYMDKKLAINVNQYNYLSFDDLLGPAVFSYTDVDGNPVDVDIEITSKVDGSILNFTGKFVESMDELSIPFTYLDDEERDGELRFYTRSILLDSFEDENYTNVKALSAYLYILRTLTAAGSQSYTYSTSTSVYYPAEGVFTDTSNVYSFEHSEAGLPATTLYSFKALGIAIAGSNASGSVKYGDYYVIMFDPVLSKPL